MRYTGPKNKQSRREGCDLYGKGEKAFGCKGQKKYPPGVHGKTIRKNTEYGRQLRAKQKAKRYYGVSEKYFSNLFKKAHKMKGNTGDILIQMLKRRLDNAIYEAGFAHTRNMARQLINHGFFTVNGKKASIPSIQVKISDVIELKSSKQEKKDLVFGELTKAKDMSPRWLKVDLKKLHCEVLDFPKEDELEKGFVDTEHIIAFYSR